MAVKEIDTIALQSAQTLLHGLNHVITRRAPAVGADFSREGKFGRHDNLVHASFQRVPSVSSERPSL